MPDAIILPEVQVELLRRDDEKLSRIKHTLAALNQITGLPWLVSQYRADAPYTYALDDAHLPLTLRVEWHIYEAISNTINQAVNQNDALVAQHKNRRGVFPLSGHGIRIATVGGMLHNGKKLASSLQLSALVEEQEIIQAIAAVDFGTLAAPVKEALKNAKPESELLKALDERTEQSFI